MVLPPKGIWTPFKFKNIIPIAKNLRGIQKHFVLYDHVSLDKVCLHLIKKLFLRFIDRQKKSQQELHTLKGNVKLGPISANHKGYSENDNFSITGISTYWNQNSTQNGVCMELFND